MPKHERFEELCAAASIGQASGDELAELQRHLPECPECQSSYAEFLQVNSEQFARNVREQQLTSQEAIGCIDSALFRERFLKKAEAEGIVFSKANPPATIPEPRIRALPSRQWRMTQALAVAASVLLILGALAAYRWTSPRVKPQPGPGLAATVPSPLPAAALDQRATDDPGRVTVPRLEAEKRNLESEIDALKSALAAQSSALEQLQASRGASEKERESLAASIKERDAAIAERQQRLDQAQATLASVRNDLERARATEIAQLAEDRIRIHELSDQLADATTALDRERELLAAGRDTHDLMAARNLHIVDVFDTDPKGKTRPAFGRIFFTEGKSLLFYAYDLNDNRVQDAGYHYRIWGKKEGPGQAARNLGIFFSDDKAQKRWVFKYDDPKVLSKIDSVFVTLEPPSGNTMQPKGEKLMYAYLLGQANHP